MVSREEGQGSRPSEPLPQMRACYLAYQFTTDISLLKISLLKRAIIHNAVFLTILCFIYRHFQFTSVSDLVLYSARGTIIVIINALQTLYKQPVLDRENNKQLLVHRIVSRSNHLKIEIKRIKKTKKEASNSI